MEYTSCLQLRTKVSYGLTGPSSLWVESPCHKRPFQSSLRSYGERPYRAEPEPEPEPKTPTKKLNNNVHGEGRNNFYVPPGSEGTLAYTFFSVTVSHLHSIHL